LRVVAGNELDWPHRVGPRVAQHGGADLIERFDDGRCSARCDELGRRCLVAEAEPQPAFVRGQRVGRVEEDLSRQITAIAQRRFGRVKHDGEYNDLGGGGCFRNGPAHAWCL
jgi:hypothetical protein